MEKFKSPFLWINGEKSKSLHLSDILTNQNHLFSVLVPHIDAVVARILVGKVPVVKSQLDRIIVSPYDVPTDHDYGKCDTLWQGHSKSNLRDAQGRVGT